MIYALMMASMASMGQVVTEVDAEDDDDIDEADELVVTDQSGNEEIIEFPEAMT